MRVILQRVSRASVTVDGVVTGAIDTGLLVLLGISKSDQQRDADYLVDKIAGLRIFPDDAGKMNRSVEEIGGALLVVSQFTLYGDCRKGRRPGFDLAAPPDLARPLYEYFVARARARALQVETGIFQAHMDVALVNDGPVTFLLDS
jgi:D-tyrosyl-tRNA(Tyr) deacylase